MPRTASRIDFNEEIYRYLTRPPAVHQIINQAEKKKVYDVVYQNYMVGDTSRALIFAKDYDGQDPASINEINDIVKFLVAAYGCIQRNELDPLRNVEDMAKFVSEFYDRDLVENYTLNFNSPGQIGFYPRRAALGMFVTFAVSIAAGGGLSGCADGTPKIKNSQGQSEDIEQHTQESFDVFIDTMRGSPVLEEMETKARNAERDIGLSTPVVKIDEQ